MRGNARVIVINASYALAPWADVLYCADEKPYRWYWKKGPQGFEQSPMCEFAGLKYSLTSTAARFAGVTVLRRGTETGLSLKPTALSTGQNSGYQAINLAVLLGAARVVLLGYDLMAAKGKEHWHADHPNRSRSPYGKLRQFFPTLVEPLAKAGVEIVNCSRETALTCFPRKSLAEVFPVHVEAVA